MGYIARAFIRCENYELKRNIQKCIDDLGYELFDTNINRPIFVIHNGVVSTNEVATPQASNFIDCNLYANGDEDLAVALFLELAEMKDNSHRKWVFWGEIVQSYKDGEEVEYLAKKFGKVDVVQAYHEELTPLELAEAVRDGKIKLLNK